MRLKKGTPSAEEGLPEVRTGEDGSPKLIRSAGYDDFRRILATAGAVGNSKMKASGV